MGTLGDVTGLLADALSNAAAAWSDPELLASFLRDIGWSLANVPPSLAAIAAPAEALAAVWDDVRNADLGPAEIERLVNALRDLWNALLALENVADPPDAPGLAADLARTIVDYWIIVTVERQVGVALPFLELLGIVEIRHVGETPPRKSYTLRRIAWDRVPGLLSDPSSGFRARFGWGTDAFAAGEVLSAIRGVLAAMRLSAALVQTPDDELAIGGAPSTDPVLAVDLQLFDASTETTAVQGGVRFVPLAPPGTHPGLALVPYLTPGLGTSFAIDPRVTLQIDATFDLEGGLLLSWLPDQGLALKTDFGSGGVARTTGHAAVALVVDDPDRPETTFIDGLGLTVAARSVEGAARIALEPSPLFGMEVAVKGGHLTWDSSQAPGVLGQLFGGRKFDLATDLAIGWDSASGFYFGGGTALEAAIPASIQLGPVALSAVRVGAEPAPSGGALVVGLDGKLAIGPVTIGWQRLGVRLSASRGQTAPIEFGIDFAFPNLISLSLDTPLLTGAGAIQRIDADHFAGALALEAVDLEIAAAASVARAPTGTSIAAIAAAEFPGIPIGLGFVLDGLTAVLGIDRRVDVDFLRGSLRTGGIAHLLNVAGDPAAALAALGQAFPVAPGRTIVGLGPGIGWGTPRALQADLVVLLELPSPVRVDLLAAIQIGLPTLDHRFVDLRIDALGVFDLERETLALDASLHDSTIAGYALTGDMALRLGWGEDSQFLLSLGGFHPHFAAPPAFPALRRLALTAGDNPQLRMSAYLALTSNTAQVGAQADLTASGGGFEIKAHVGFDALFEFVPFHFETEITASASIAWHGHNLLGVSLDFLLTGPHPWHAKGDATFSVLWWDVSVGFDETWGDATPAPLPPPPPIGAVLTEALGRDEAWSGELAAGEGPWVTFKDGAAGFHPFATLVVREHAVPLGLPITQFGNVPLAAAQEFSFGPVTVGPHTVSTTAVSDVFAPAQFTQLGDDARLAAPSFERFTSGVRIAGDEVRLGPSARQSMDADTEVVDPLAPPPAPPHPVLTAISVLTIGSVVRPTGPLAPPAPAGPRLGDLSFTLASIDDLSITAEGAAIGAGKTTYAALREALSARAAEIGRVPRLQIVPRIQTANPDARVVVVREDENMRNTDFVDTLTGRGMTRAEFVEAIHAGQYRDYYVRTINGVATPVSKPNRTTRDNLG